MNKQEALKRIEVQKETLIRLTGWAVYVYIEELIKSLDESEKIKIPQFVADWIEYFRKSGDWDLFQAMDYMFGKKEIKEWLEDKDNQDLFARAWLDGYEVEEEKRYLVSLKNGQPLVRAPLGKNLYFNQNITAGNYKATRKQLEEAGYGWVFDCPGIEIEEVE